MTCCSSRPLRDDVVFRDIAGGLTAAQQAEIFWNAVGSTQESARNQGPRRAATIRSCPWRNNFDLRISQELPGFFEGNNVDDLA